MRKRNTSAQSNYWRKALGKHRSTLILFSIWECLNFRPDKKPKHCRQRIPSGIRTTPRFRRKTVIAKLLHITNPPVLLLLVEVIYDSTRTHTEFAGIVAS